MGAGAARRPPHHSNAEGPHLPPHLSLILQGDPPPMPPLHQTPRKPGMGLSESGDRWPAGGADASQLPEFGESWTKSAVLPVPASATLVVLLVFF